MKLVLVGSGGHAGDVLGLIEDIRRLKKYEFGRVLIADERLDRPDRFVGRQAELVLGEARGFQMATHFISAKGYSQARAETAARAVSSGLEPCVPLIHPLGNLNPNVSIGVGSVVLALCSMSPGVRVGNHCYISHGVLIGHDTIIGDFTSVMPGASISGDVTIGSEALIGAGAIVLEKVKVGQRATVGAGAVVVNDVADGETVLGIPAKPKT